MGFLEMIKQTDDGKVAQWFNGDELITEKAEICDNCGAYRPVSKLTIRTLGSGYFVQFCKDEDECDAYQASE